VSSHCNVPRHERIAPAACECACSAHAADEYITFDTCYPHCVCMCVCVYVCVCEGVPAAYWRNNK